MLKVKVEIFKPYRKEVAAFIVDDNEPMEKRNAAVNDQIKELMPQIVAAHPKATELRWEYPLFGQGHYIQIGGC